MQCILILLQIIVVGRKKGRNRKVLLHCFFFGRHFVLFLLQVSKRFQFGEIVENQIHIYVYICRVEVISDQLNIK